MKTVTIDMKQFSKAPFGRYAEDGPWNGEAFRETLLYPALADPEVDKVVVKLDSVVPGYEYGSSFLEEAFGGLVRVRKLESGNVLARLKIETKNADYAFEINTYISEADK